MTYSIIYSRSHFLMSSIFSAGEGDRVGRCNCAVVGRPTNFDNSRARAYCACSRCGLGLFRHFFLSSIMPLFYLPLGDGLIYIEILLKYCFKGPLTPKQPTN